MSRSLSRREFLEKAGLTAAVAAGAAALTPQPLLARQSRRKQDQGANEDIVIALVGCGGMGRANLADFMREPYVKVAALCDVDTRRIDEAMADVQNAGRPTDGVTRHQDFREVIDRDDIDAVIVGTPDHWHAYVTIAACNSGKDVYCEKPVSHNIVEGRAMVNAARRNQRIIQIGTQQRSGAHFQSAVELVRSGLLGTIQVCRTWIVGNNAPEGNGNPPDGEPPPEVDYNMWLGPAPERPFNPNRFHYQFRWFWDYGNGLCNDWGVHLNDLVLWAMDRVAPVKVSAHGGKYVLTDNSDTPDTLEITYDYADFVHTYTVRRASQNAGYHGRGHGMEFQGHQGNLILDRGGWQVNPEGDRIEPQSSGGSDQHYPHVVNFLECVKSRELPISDIEVGHRSTSTCHLANIAYKVGRTIQWDAEQEICVKADGSPDDEANQYLFREPRAPWTLEM